MKKVGIIGGGQLALFLAEAAQRLQWPCVVLSDEARPPAREAADELVVGSSRDPKVLRDFFSKVKTVVFENEWVDTLLLEKESRGQVRFLPELALMRRLQDKLSQKEELLKLGIPTPDFVILDLAKDLREELAHAFARLGSSLVLKWSRNGYDGKGVLFVDSDTDSASVASDFCRRAAEAGSRVFAEPRVPFERELALVAVRSTHGAFRSYPLVVSIQNRGTCEWILGTADRLGVAPSLEGKAASYASRLAESLGLVGAFAIEFFLTASGELLVNEISPRVHNSGHYTLEACSMSQFEAHMRAVMGMELPSLRTQPYFAMLNLLGPDGVSIDDLGDGVPRAPEGIFLHWYGKKALRPRRKMGHVTAYASSEQEMKVLIEKIRRFEQD